MAGERTLWLWQALAQRVRAAWQDLFGEGASGSNLAGGAWADEAQALLATADARLAELRQAWAAALARAHQAEAAWQAAREPAECLDKSVNEALAAGQDDVARERQRELNLWQQRLEALDQRRRSEANLARAMARTIRNLEMRIGATREQAASGRRDGLA